MPIFLLPPSLHLAKEVGVSAPGSRRNTFLCFSHLHSSGIITRAASCGKQTCTSTNYSSFPQWVVLNRTLASGTGKIIRLSKNKQGKLRDNISPVQAKQGAWGVSDGRVDGIPLHAGRGRMLPRPSLRQKPRFQV